MERRKLLAVGGMLGLTAFATTVGLGATFGLFGLTEPDSSVGRLGGPRPAAAAVREQEAAPSSPAPAPAPGPDDLADD